MFPADFAYARARSLDEALDLLDEAAEALVVIMRKSRDWNEDGARKKLLELFEAWGPKDPATLKGRRLLSSLLFA